APRRPLPPGPPASRRRAPAQAFARVPGGRRVHPTGVQGREAGTLRSDGAKVLMTADSDSLGDVLDASDRRQPGSAAKVPLKLKIRRYNPEVRDDSWWDEFEIEMEPNDRLLDALHHVKWY